jgi:hypothetical protein
MRSPPTPYDTIADNINYQIARNECARHDRWSKKGLRAPKKRLS